MAAGSGMKNIHALIPDVGSRRPPVRKKDHTMFCCWRILRMEDVKQHKCTLIEGERERHTHTKRYIFINKRQQLQMNNNLYKRLQSHFI